MSDATLSYYEKNAQQYFDQTAAADMASAADRFQKYLPKDALLLDFGCGSGRDTRYFMEQGFRVEAIDGSRELASLARANTGVNVKCMRFSELSEIDRYDGIWACASILHLRKEELAEVFRKMSIALKPHGVLYASFKYGTFEGDRGDRYFTDFTEKTFSDFLQNAGGFEILEEWISADVRQERCREKWLNLVLRKCLKKDCEDDIKQEGECSYDLRNKTI